jgi:hypothetical protein
MPGKSATEPFAELSNSFAIDARHYKAVCVQVPTAPCNVKIQGAVVN